MAKKNTTIDSGETTVFENNTMGLTLYIPVPKDPNSAFGSAVVERGFYLWLMYQGWNVEFRDALCSELEKQTGIARRQAVKNGVPQVRKTKEGETPVLESEKSYVDWLIAEGSVSESDYNTLGQSVAATIPVRLPGTGESSRKPNKDCYEAARLYLAQIKAGSMSLDTLTAAYDSKNSPSFADLGGEANEDTLAKMVQIDEARKAKAKKPTGFGD